MQSPMRRPSKLKGVYLEEFKRTLVWAIYRKAIQEIEENRLNLAL